MTHQGYSKRCDTLDLVFQSGDVCALASLLVPKAEIRAPGSTSWPPPRTNDDCHPDKDSLPPFELLECDEDRERKAEHRLPGTYHIITNPSSFEGLEEYDGDRHESSSEHKAKPVSNSVQRSSSANDCPTLQRPNVFEDPETLILGTFEDNNRRSPALALTTQLSNSPTSSQTSHSPATTYRQSANPWPRSKETSPRLENILQNRADQEILSFYKTFVRSQLNQVHRDSLGTPSQSGTQTFPEILDKHADSFPPVSLEIPSIYSHAQSVPSSAPSCQDVLALLFTESGFNCFSEEPVLKKVHSLHLLSVGCDASKALVQGTTIDHWYHCL